MRQINFFQDFVSDDDVKTIYESLSKIIISLDDFDFLKYLSVKRETKKQIKIKIDAGDITNKKIPVAEINILRKVKYIKIYSRRRFVYFPNYALKNISRTVFRIEISGITDALKLMEPLGHVFIDKLSEIDGDPFGCCHRYIDCSNEMKCLHPDKLRSLSCEYRKNLKAGRVFYGKNRNH